MIFNLESFISAPSSMHELDNSKLDETDIESSINPNDLAIIAISESFKNEPKKYFLIFANNYFNCYENKSEIILVLEKFIRGKTFKNAFKNNINDNELVKVVMNFFQEIKLYADPNYSRSLESYISDIL